MAAFFALPLDISLAILEEWIDLNALGRLDSACAGSDRQDFLTIIHHPAFTAPPDVGIFFSHASDNIDFAQWVQVRGVKLAAFVLYLDNLEEWAKIDPVLLDKVTVVKVERDDDDMVSEETIDLVHFHTLFSHLPSLTCLDMEYIYVSDECADYVGILASMTHMKMKKIILDFACYSAKHVGALVTSFHGTLEWLCLGTQRKIQRGDRCLEMISTMCTKLTYLDVTLDDESSGAQVLAAFASDRLPLLKFLSLGTDMDQYSKPDTDIEDADLVAICRYHPLLEVLTIPLGKRTTLASCAEALALCPNLMHISTTGYSLEVKSDSEKLVYTDKRSYCVVNLKTHTAPIEKSDVRTIVALRPFPICRISCICTSETNVAVLAEVAGHDLKGLELLGMTHVVDMPSLIQVLNNCPFISRLKCSGSHISDDMLVAIPDHMQNVQYFRFYAWEGVLVSDAGVVYLLEKIGSNLKTLDFSFTRQLSRASLSAIVAHCPMLTDLDVSYADISAQAFMKILIMPDALPLLTRFSVSDKTGLQKLMKSNRITENSRWWRMVQ